MSKPVVQFKPKAETVAPQMPGKKPRRRTLLTLARASVIVAGIGLAVVVPLGWGSWVAGLTNQTTDNATLRADTTPVSAEVAGRVTRLLVADYQEVRAGDLLMQIDPTEYQARVDQARAGVAAAGAAIHNIESQIALQHRVIEQAEAGLAALQADRERIESENQRQTTLKQGGWASGQKLEAAVADMKRIEATIIEQQAEIAARREQLNVLATQSEQAGAELNSREAALTLARIDLDRTRITAPIDGVVGTSGVREGQYVRAGAQLVSVVPMTQLYVTANFKETQLAKVRPGQAVSLRIDTFPGEVLTGHVERLSPATGSVFSLLPADNATGNFTKIAQRISVRIALDDQTALAGLLRPGMSVEATVHTDREAAGAGRLAAVR
ncbi:HlyD family secretion protein [Paracoccus lutimaris]|uniref:Membrane fusion protein (Multidrug efflux system) n=1 Tax=Paracoccus lutimaris TaxID=1490030 RepID=A0A368YHZ4_9RHOB|nr:HlyD family secretion protein [Paracoccus lutimaris]RCW79269.1 membrane fusion protein (multidrug efflux system) [Paracoccus lutimaris]